MAIPLLPFRRTATLKATLGSSDQLSITDNFRLPTGEGLAAHLNEGSATVPDALQKPSHERSETMSKRRAMRANHSKVGV